MLGFARITQVYGNAAGTTASMVGGNCLASSSSIGLVTTLVSFTGIFFAQDEVDVTFYSYRDQPISAYGDTRVTVTLVRLLA